MRMRSYALLLGLLLLLAAAAAPFPAASKPLPPSLTWSVVESPVDFPLYSIAHGNGIFLAVGRAGRWITSETGGLTWKPHTAPSLWQAPARVRFGSGQFFLAATDGQGQEGLFTSPDGRAWTRYGGAAPGETAAGRGMPAVTPPGDLQRVVYGNGRFVALDTAGVLYSTPNGIDWVQDVTAKSMRRGDGPRQADVAYGQGHFVAVGGDGFLLRSKVCGDAFLDVSADHPACDAVEQLARQVQVAGTGTGRFRPDDLLTRAELATLLVRTMHWAPDPSRPLPFPDTAGHWAAVRGYVAVAGQRGVLVGFPDGTWRPNQAVTRAEAVRAVSAAVGDAGPDSLRTLTGVDAPWPLWPGEELAAAVPVTRAEAAMLLSNLWESLAP